MQSFLDYIWDAIMFVFNRNLYLQIPVGYSNNYIKLSTGIFYCGIFALIIAFSKKLYRW